MTDGRVDAVVVGAGPNGLSAAVCLARAGLSVRVFEKGSIGGGTRTEELTLPGFHHDVCSAVHPLAVASPFLAQLPLESHGLEWVHPDVPLAHPFDDGTVALLQRSVHDTAQRLEDPGYAHLFKRSVAEWPRLAGEILAPLHLPRYPLSLALFGMKAVLPARWLAALFLRKRESRALFGGMAAHSFLPPSRFVSGGFGLMMGTLGHVAGWPIARGGSRAITSALASILREFGGEIETEANVETIDQLPRSRIVILNLTSREFLRVAGHRLPEHYRGVLRRYRYGAGVFKIDWALSAPIPWRSRECARAATVHVGGTFQEIARAEMAVSRGRLPERPFVLVVQPTLFDPTRAPNCKHIGWAYGHVPNGSTMDMTERIESHIEAYAPGFRSIIIARSTRNALQYEEYNPNFVGGDINGGVQDVWQFMARPRLLNPYRTPLKGVYIASSGTPPGGGVHGMAGFHAACTALADLRQR